MCSVCFFRFYSFWLDLCFLKTIKKKNLAKSQTHPQYPRKTLFFGSFGLKRVFRFSKYFFLNRKTTSAKSLDGLAKKRVITEYRNTQQITEIHHQHKENYVHLNKNKQHRNSHSSSNKVITSGSDLSETQNDFIIGGGVGGGGQHRNSSSGYVSKKKNSIFNWKMSFICVLHLFNDQIRFLFGMQLWLGCVHMQIGRSMLLQFGR